MTTWDFSAGSPGTVAGLSAPGVRRGSQESGACIQVEVHVHRALEKQRFHAADGVIVASLGFEWPVAGPIRVRVLG